MNISSRSPTASLHFNNKSQSFSQYFKVSDPCRKVSVNKNKCKGKVKCVHHTCDQWYDDTEQLIIWMCTELIYSMLWPRSKQQRLGSVDYDCCPITTSNAECDNHYVELTIVCLHLVVPLLQWWLYIFYWHTIRHDMQFGLERTACFYETLCSLLSLTTISTWVCDLDLVIWATECSNSTDHRTGNVHKWECHCRYVAKSLMTFM